MQVIEHHELMELVLASGLQGEPALLIQVGANEGRFEYSKPSGKDFVFEFLLENPAWNAVLLEPFSQAFNLLKKNYIQHLNKITFLKCAVTEAIEMRNLHVSGRDGKTSSLLGQRPHESIRAENVLCLPLSTVFDVLGLSQAALLKIDTEGYDAAIINSLLSTCHNALLPRVLIWEWEARQSQGLVERLEDHGYAVFSTGRTRSGQLADRVAVREV
jgi:FkbM family methyltransferase